MSRAPTIASAGVGKATGKDPAEVLGEIRKLTHVDVSPGLWACATAAINPRDFRFQLGANE